MITQPRLLGCVLLATSLLTACGTDTPSTLPLAANRAEALLGSGAVAIASNATAGNELLVFNRLEDGALGAPVAYATGGTGTGSGLGNQSGLALAMGARWLLAVNAGSNDVSVFDRSGQGLVLTDRLPSGGTLPISIAVHGNLVYVLDAGGSGNISGFRLGTDGRLTPLAGSSQPLGGVAVGPAQVGFSPDGRQLVVTEKAANAIAIYPVDADGRAGAPTLFPSAGQTPFGFAFDRRGLLLVSDAFGGAADASALSAYRLGESGVTVTAASVGTNETAACWVAVTPNSRYAYTTNTGSASISGFRIGPDGGLTLLTPGGVTGQTGAGPIDLAIAANGRRLFT
jgi:DNA-binding beta-propeller fold protein YncE